MYTRRKFLGSALSALGLGLVPRKEIATQIEYDKTFWIDLLKKDWDGAFRAHDAMVETFCYGFGSARNPLYSESENRERIQSAMLELEGRDLGAVAMFAKYIEIVLSKKISD